MHTVCHSILFPNFFIPKLNGVVHKTVWRVTRLQRIAHMPGTGGKDFAATFRGIKLTSFKRLCDKIVPSPPVGGAQAQAGSARPRIPNGCRTESPCGTENRSPKKRGTRHRIAEKKQNTARQPLPRMIAPVPALPARFSPAFAAVVSPAGKGPSPQFYSHSI